MENVLQNNKIYLEGVVSSGLEFSHEMYGEGFYTFYIEVQRLSDAKDELLVTVSERLIGNMDLKVGAEVVIEGQLRSYNKFVEGSNRLILTVFARNIEYCIERTKNPNQILLNGFICKPPVYRTTPFGREIADLLLAVNRAYNKSDYIPTIAWGRNARFCEELNVGDNVRIWGRLQSREYQKKISEDEVIKKIAYEVSISKMEKISDDKKDLVKDIEEVEEDICDMENVEDARDVEDIDDIDEIDEIDEVELAESLQI
ncbi:single-stranded DNA-binding protein [Clostridium sp. MSJ-11]|uniref:Single-stranded DNA-binding protein n=1 Tax=Clostridium mobile TaxID=2841512 RepID=A0ABS6EKW4_9CLOT|nr:single-stranded DNA-binding protein [Clostridium mobile]MBU5485452.1 single-stranded DNA-binding protein [Clostridium mobile]